ncbi:hypothetical protein EIP91_003146 [Steccherinum ochraceum]|uniref:Smr domain-containing protein n=1 Tax=Steccherinum ochraceum TaxID=92696 RepID=A0A4R0RVR4_9APHY|nr:hypothetical protein EIP91_003146 [Steccherinum ochraceum]
MGSHSKLQDDLQAEFSPPLDASLIAAIVADYVSDNDQKTPSRDVIQQLRNQLSQLAAQAEQDEHVLSEQLSHFSLLDTGNSIATDDTNSLSNDTSTLETTTAFTTPSSCNGSEGSSSSSPRSFSSPLGFLQAAFPYLPTSTLRNALGSMGDIDDIDMEAVVESILSKEYIRDLEERGLEDADEVGVTEVLWQTVDRKKSPQSVKATKKQKKPTMTMTFGDVRQHTQVRTSSAPNTPRPSTSADPWTQVSSMAAHLSTLLPSHSPSFFQSIFHSPKYASPSTALRATLASISVSEIPDAQMAILYNLFDILVASDSYDETSPKARDALLSDAQLAFRAARFDPEAALSLLEVMKSLDSDSVSGEWGLFHSPVPASPNPVSQPKSPTTRNLPSGPPPIAPPPPGRQRSYPSTPTNAWKTVPPARKSLSTSGYSHADFIPAYNTGKKAKMKGSGNGIGKGGKGDVGELGSGGGKKAYSGRASELLKKRNEALREASRAWQRGSNKTRGGEIAQFYAAKARELSQQARDENLAAAHDRVYSKRQTTNNCTTIDLHGTTVDEAVAIVQSILVEDCPTEVKPLKVITGRGSHSVNGVGVLGPRIKAALIADGWNVGSWDAGLVVRGKVLRRP